MSSSRKGEMHTRYRCVKGCDYDMCQECYSSRLADLQKESVSDGPLFGKWVEARFGTPLIIKSTAGYRAIGTYLGGRGRLSGKVSIDGRSFSGEWSETGRRRDRMGLSAGTFSLAVAPNADGSLSLKVRPCKLTIARRTAKLLLPS